MPGVPLDDDPRPLPPPRPTLYDCCKGGCDPCVFDLYDEAVARYEAELRVWQARKDSGLRRR